MRVYLGFNNPPQWGNPGIQRGYFIWHLRHRNIHRRERILVESTVVHVANNSNDLPRSFNESRAYVSSNNNAVLQWITFGPELLGHGFIDDYNAGRRPIILSSKISATQDRSFVRFKESP